MRDNLLGGFYNKDEGPRPRNSEVQHCYFKKLFGELKCADRIENPCTATLVQGQDDQVWGDRRLQP